MSSFIGHGLIGGVLTYVSTKNRGSAWWLVWLGCLAVSPDIDYLIHALRLESEGGFYTRVTHSLVGVLLLPALTVIALALGRRYGKFLAAPLALRARQAFFAGFSHLLLDVLVGTSSYAIFWPVSDYSFHMPFGLLPNAGALYFSNYYLWRNWAIELGVLLPMALVITMWSRKFWSLPIRLMFTLPLLAISAYAMLTASELTRT